MNILYISGSPRKESNTDILLKLTMSITGGEFNRTHMRILGLCKNLKIIM